MTLPPLITQLLDTLLPGLRDALGDNLTGVYLGDSLALGGYDPETSDIDILVATERPLADAELAAIAGLRERVPPQSNEYPEYEAYFIDRATLRRFAPGQRHVKVAWDERVEWIEHRPAWVFERWTLREHGITLLGPDPKTLIDPISPEDLVEAAGSELRARWRNWRGGRWPRSELQTYLGAQAYEVETVCRALCTTERGEMVSKRDAIAWGIANLPARWHPLLEWSQTVRKIWEPGDARVDEVLGFLEWAIIELDTPER